MNPFASPWMIAAALVALIVSALGGGWVGMKVERSDWQDKELTRAEKVIVRERVITKEVPTIVTKVVEKRVEVQKEVERVVTKIPDLVAADCVLPDNYGRLLVLAANGLDPATARGTESFTGAYGCREVLEATLRDLEAGYVNSERLAGLQRWVEVVRKDTP